MRLSDLPTEPLGPTPKSARTLGLPAALLFVAMFNLTVPVAGAKEWIVDDLGGSLQAAALFWTIEMLGYVVGAPLAGFASDRTARRRPFVVWGFATSAALCFAYARLDSLPTILALRFVQGVFSVAAWSSVMALVVDFSSDSDRGRRMGWAGGSLILGVGLGAPLGGYLARDFGVRAPLAVAGGLFALLALAALALPEPPRPRDRPGLAEVARALAATRSLLWPCAFYAVERLSVGLLIVVLPLYLQAAGGADPVLRGRYLALFLLPFAALQSPFGRLVDRLGAKGLLVGGTLVYGAAFASIGFLDRSALWGGMALLGVAAAMMFPPTLALIAAWSPPEARGSATAGFNVAGSLGFAAGPLAGAWLAAAAGYRIAFLVAGGLAVAIALAASVALPTGPRGSRAATRPS